MASRGEQGSEQCGAPNFFDGLGQWACQEAAGREKLGSKTPAPAQEVGVSRRRPLARAPCLRGSEFSATWTYAASARILGIFLANAGVAPREDGPSSSRDRLPVSDEMDDFPRKSDGSFARAEDADGGLICRSEVE